MYKLKIFYLLTNFQEYLKSYLIHSNTIFFYKIISNSFHLEKYNLYYFEMSFETDK
jgi:hypothetical protein